MQTPQPHPPVPENDPDRAWTGSAAQSLAGFSAGLGREAEALEELEFEELCRAVDGELDLSEQALWAERLAGDRRLARRAADLASFRAELDNPAGAKVRVLTFRRPPARVSLSGWLAAAAVLLLALAVRETPRLVEEHGSLRAAVPQLLDWSDEQLFADGFEAGDASGWTSSSPSG